MRKVKIVPRQGDERCVSYFQLFPRTLLDEAGTHITRWLERVAVKQRYTASRHGSYWSDIRWADLPEAK